MGSIWFESKTFCDHIHEIVGFKSGIATSIEQMCDLLTNTSFPDILLESEKNTVRIRSEDYDSLYYHLLYKLGVTNTPLGGQFELMSFLRKFNKDYGMEKSEIFFDLFHKSFNSEIRIASKNNGFLDHLKIINPIGDKLGLKFKRLALDYLLLFNDANKLSPMNRWERWDNKVNLDDLFYSGTQSENMVGEFIDQRYINFLSANLDKLSQIHWRKFEELTAEYFHRQGYKVDLGSGTNDDGVDLRIWNDKVNSPEYIIQCKRQAKKIDKVTVKGLYTDVIYEGASQGLLVTSSEFSPGARQTVEVRGYPISEINGDKVKEWIVSLRVPGVGIVRV